METLEKVLECYNLSIEDISDRIVSHLQLEDNLDEI
jgi:hypothetical protein